jgi:hypothetical protein
MREREPFDERRITRKRWIAIFLSVLSLCICVIAPQRFIHAQGFTLHAVEEGTNKPLSNIPITMRYNCTPVGSGLKLKWIGCRWIQRRTDKAGLAHFPEAGSLHDIDDVYSLPIVYAMTCCDVQPKTFSSEARMKFRKRSFAEQLHWIFIGN